MNELTSKTDKNELNFSKTEVVDDGLHQLMGAHSSTATGSFGKIILQHFQGDNFTIGYNSFRIQRPVKLDESEWPIKFENKFITFWQGVNHYKWRQRQYQIIFEGNTTSPTQLYTAGNYEILLIALSNDLLKSYAAHCPRLATYFENADKGDPANLLDRVVFLTPGMEQAIYEILTYSMLEELAADFFKRKVNDLLVHMVHHLNTLDSMPAFDLADIKKAEEVKRIIVADFSVNYSVEILARKLGLSEQKLQMIFKYCYGVTVGKFSKDQRMKKAHELLMGTNEILLSIALMVGYSDPGNFSTAFKNHFGYSPGHVQKRLGKQRYSTNKSENLASEKYAQRSI